MLPYPWYTASVLREVPFKTYSQMTICVAFFVCSLLLFPSASIASPRPSSTHVQTLLATHSTNSRERSFLPCAKQQYQPDETSSKGTRFFCSTNVLPPSVQHDFHSVDGRKAELTPGARSPEPVNFSGACRKLDVHSSEYLGKGSQHSFG